jgi:16S rRNA (cytosine1402-N4)-methyltransferase
MLGLPGRWRTCAATRGRGTRMIDADIADADIADTDVADTDVAGADLRDGLAAPHKPVMLPEVLTALALRDGDHIVDGTFGAGGYSRAILAAGARVTALDRDPAARKAGDELAAAFPGRFELVETPFSALSDCVDAPVDGIVLDIGVSSMQFDQADRGFSFRFDGPLDMRMAQSGVSAADVVNTEGHGRLAAIFARLGEERHAGRIATMILRKREVRRFATTRALADAIEALVGRKPGDRIHPATRVFQALRIYVNDELGELAAALEAAERALKPGGRLVVVTFHSLEDRMVKRFLADRGETQAGSRHLPAVAAALPTFTPAGRGHVSPGEAEMAANPRARSAKLRAAIRTAAPPRSGAAFDFGLGAIPRLGQV